MVDINRDSFYKIAFWTVVPIVLGTCVTLVSIGIRTSNQQATQIALLNQTLVTQGRAIDEIKGSLEQANTDTLNLFLRNEDKTNNALELINRIRIGLAKAGIEVPEN